MELLALAVMLGALGLRLLWLGIRGSRQDVQENLTGGTKMDREEELRALREVLEPIEGHDRAGLRRIAGELKGDTHLTWHVGEMLERACIFLDAAPPYRRPLDNWWLSWYQKPEEPFTLSWPWWRTGETGDGMMTICAAIQAESREAAERAIADAMDHDFAILWRFCERKHRYWSPFSDRFPRAPWMMWPEGE